MEATTSCQVTKIPLITWKVFRKQCIEAEVSCNKRLLQLIEADVATEQGRTHRDEQSSKKEQHNG
jgi:hypothetical protein